MLVVSEGTLANQPTSFYNLFQVEYGKFAERWDTIETILPKSEVLLGNSTLVIHQY